MSEPRYHSEAQMEVKDALISFLEDQRNTKPDAAVKGDREKAVHYNKKTLDDAIIVIMDAFGYKVIDNDCM